MINGERCEICEETIADFYSDLKQMYYCQECWNAYIDEVAAEYLILAETTTSKHKMHLKNIFKGGTQ